MPRKPIDWDRVVQKLLLANYYYRWIGLVEATAFFIAMVLTWAKMDNYRDLRSQVAHSRQAFFFSFLEAHLAVYGFVFLLWVGYRVYARYFDNNWTD